MSPFQQGVALRPVRRYLAELGYAIDPRSLIERETQRLSTLCYLCVDDRLLMLRRRKEPFANHWTAPGGKIQDGEDPRQAIIREVCEETQLRIARPVLRAVCSEVGGDAYNWLLFVFGCDEYEGEMAASDEGELAWIPVAELETWTLPDVDRHILRYILQPQPEPSFIRVAYTADHSVESFAVRPLSEVEG